MLGRKIFGLDISDHSIEALVLTKLPFGKPKIVSYARIVLRGEVVKNGVIKKPDKLAESIKKLLSSAKPKSIKTPYCILSLPESQVFTTIFKLPAGLKHKEIKNTIPYKAEEVIPFKSSEIYFDFKTITKKGTTQEVFYVAVPIKVVDGYVEVLESIGLKPMAFDLESISLGRALLTAEKKSDSAKLMVDIGARTTNLNIFDHNGIRQSLSINVAGERFTKAIIKKLGVTAKEADELKMTSGFDPKKGKGKVLLVLQNEFKRIINETKKLIDYYRTQNQREINEIIIVGGSSLLPKMDQYLADNLGIEVNNGNPLIKVSDPKEFVNLKDRVALFANVIGLALRGVAKNSVSGDINLLPVKIRKFALLPNKEEKKTWRFIYIRLAIFILLAVGFLGIFALRQQGQDFYQKVISSPEYDSAIDSEVDVGILEELRQKFLEPFEETATTTEEIVEEPKVWIEIKPTSVGYLNVREGPSIDYLRIAQVNSGEKYILISEEDDWYQIQVDEENIGWVYSVFADKLEEVDE